jgi:cation diffusion facilitator family transporter
MVENSSNLQRYSDIRKVTVVGAVINAVLSIVKVIVGFVGQSYALITDGIHSLSDLASDAMVVLAAKQGSQEADEEHPYGHARIETAFTVALGVLLITIAMGISVDAGRRLLNPTLLLHPHPLALLIALLSVLSKEMLYQYTMRVAKRVRSPLLRANAWHHRTDALSSVVVLVGVAGAIIGFDSLDAIASIGVALMIAKIGWDLGWDAIRELVDTGLEPERVAKIRESITQVNGVEDFHMLRTRRMGGHALVDVHVQVNPRLSVSEGHQIGEYVRTKLVNGIDEVADVTVHIDSEDDKASLLCEGLPMRREVLEQLQKRWHPIIDPALIKDINLHYLSGKIHVDLILPFDRVDTLDQARSLAQRLNQTSQDMKFLGSVQIYFV